MKAALLGERGVVKVAGEDARKFLNGLLTTDVAKVSPRRASFAALLTPQGKVMVDMIVAEAPAEDGGGFFIDCPRALSLTLTDRLNFYKLRAKVLVEDLSAVLGVHRRVGRHAADRVWPVLCRPASRSARDALHAAAASCRGGGRRPRRHAGRSRRIRSPSHRARRAARRVGFSLQRCLPARSRHGSAQRHGFRKGLLCRPGGRVARRASRHGAQARGAGHLRGFRRRKPASR